MIARIARSSIRSLYGSARGGRAFLLAALVGLAAAPGSARAQQKAELLPGLLGLDHVVIGANDVAGAVAAYQRLGFNVVPLKAPEGGGPGGLVDLGNGFLEFTTPSVDSLGRPEPYTFEGGVGQGWEVRSAKEATASPSKDPAPKSSTEPPLGMLIAGIAAGLAITTLGVWYVRRK